MTAFNVVRFRVKPGREEEFVAAHRRMPGHFEGGRRFVLIKTGERSYCVVGEWESLQHMAAARPGMIAMLDTFRDTLEDLGAGSASPIRCRARWWSRCSRCGRPRVVPSRLDRWNTPAPPWDSTSPSARTACFQVDARSRKPLRASAYGLHPSCLGVQQWTYTNSWDVSGHSNRAARMTGSLR